ncbi:MAG: hypothetical protein KDA99_28650, partial [Planctomycetales bacterium]|nr:hypothetical protein [Planctomycetales bacterium]
MEPDRLHEEEQWVRRLRSDGAERDGAIAELRDVLVRGLHRSLGQEYGGYALVEDVAQEALLKILK